MAEPRGLLLIGYQGRSLLGQACHRRYGPRGEPLTIAEWIEGLRSEASHWWPEPTTPRAVRESAADIERMSAREKMEAAMAGVRGTPR